MTARSKPNELYITRLYDAPVKMVWEAWTDPEQVARWWGPRGFTLTTHSKDLRTGGHWDYTMHGPDGTDYPNLAKYLEVIPMFRLVYDHGGTHDKPALFRVNVEFKELGNQTQMEMTMTLPTEEAAKEISKFIKKAGGNGTWDRLAEHLAKKITDKDLFFIHRSFNASIDVMYKMWTDPKHFSQWIAPTGFTTEFYKSDIRTGGESFYKMSSDMYSMYGRANYIEVSPTKLVYTQVFCDKDGNISRHPMAPTWPEIMLTKVTFTEEAPNQTRVMVQWEPHGKFTQQELDTFLQARGGMSQGWTGSFDKLEEYISKV